MIYVLTGLSEEANVITDRDNVTVMTGIPARANLDSIVGDDCEAMISFGTAGALRSEVKVGEVVLPLFIATPEGVAYTPNVKWQNRIFEAFKGGVVPCPRLVGGYSGPVELAATAAQKRSLANSSNMVYYTVDMISYAVARYANLKNVPWIAIQGISDAYDQDIPPIDMQVTSPDGSPNIGALIDGLFVNPNEIRGTIFAAETFGKAISGLEWAYSVMQPWFLFDKM
jgi:adenosylhomocysteine nucleosidase